ncbi:MAG: M15 family metallopeptidase [Bacteroidales bacterium]|nr:M15 family metallopeptidase [Lachnoclostridium sp.]MCM1383076.1 M15 family metallopeptidase [Lachnoclostridium sp.]MCM1463867.1 M15 family metallopeptidase [Bacteroidales bacterium]
MNEKTLKERVKKQLFKFGRKNRICSYLVIPVLFVSMFFFHVLYYIRGNGKRFAMLAMMFCLFTVYSSFSFPLFISSDNGDGIGSLDLEMHDDIFLASEPKLDMSEAEFIEDEDILESLSSEELDHVYLSEEQMKALEKEQNKGQNASQETDLPEDDLKISENFSKDDWRLILVNKQHSIPDDYTFPKGNIKTLKGIKQCDSRILDDYNDMLEAAAKEELYLKPCSSYRDLEYQEGLINQHMVSYMNMGFSYVEAFQLSSRRVQIPGSSEHQLGLALDIVCNSHQELTEDFEDTKEGIWLAKNSYKYGFILRYPKEKEYITGVKYEPWHFRYVGIEAATVITENNMTLEEFWEEL